MRKDTMMTRRRMILKIRKTIVNRKHENMNMKKNKNNGMMKSKKELQTREKNKWMLEKMERKLQILLLRMEKLMRQMLMPCSQLK